MGVWPTQVVPVFDVLTAEAVEQAEEAELEGVVVRVVSAAHLAAMAFERRRSKDHLRVLSLLEAKAATREQLGLLAERHGLRDRWRQRETSFIDESYA